VTTIMISLFRLTIIALAAGFTASFAWGQNLVSNPGFDTDVAGWTTGSTPTYLSEVKVFRGRRPPASIIYLFLMLICVLIYWFNPPKTSSREDVRE